MASIAPDPRIQVVTVCRNDLDGVRATLASVDAQHHAPFRHIVQDGLSTDGTLQWLTPQQGPRWREVRSEPDAGIYDAMNRALDGDWDLVVFLNSGDRFADPEVLQRISTSWQRNRWAWAFGRARILRSDGSLVRVHELTRFRWVRFISGIRTVPHQSVVLSRALVDAVGVHRLDIGLSADQEYLLRCWLRSRPSRLGFVVADCDASGVSAKQPPGAFALQMRGHRRALGRRILGRSAADDAITVAAVAWDTVKRRLGGSLRALRA